MKATTFAHLQGLDELTPAEAAKHNGGLSGWGIFGIVLGGLAAAAVGVGVVLWATNKSSINVGGPW